MNDEAIEHLKNAKDEVQTAMMRIDEETESKSEWYYAETIENIENMMDIINGDDDAKAHQMSRV